MRPSTNRIMSATVLAVTAVLSSCRDQPEGAARAEASASPLASPATDGTISAGSLAAAPAQYFGRQVSVKAEVERVISNNIFTLDDDRLGTRTSSSSTPIARPRSSVRTTTSS